MRKKYFSKITVSLFSVILLMLTSCIDENATTVSDEISNDGLILSVEEENDLFKNKDSKLKKDFGIAFVLALNESKELREIIKQEALKEFNGDYDVLYPMIKNRQLEYCSVNELMAKHIKNEKYLEEILHNLPLLTIFVPSLPQDSFNAKKWNTNTEIPVVALRLNNTNHVPIIEKNGKISILHESIIPGFPVLVIKDNERVISSNQNRFSELKTRVLHKDNNIQYKLVDDNFIKYNKTSRDLSEPCPTCSPIPLDNKIIEAWNIYGQSANTGWHRDYIYYDISHSNPNGPWIVNYNEQISSFTLTDPSNNANNALNYIADGTGDANLNTASFTPDTGSNQNRGWTDGRFDFRVRAFIGSKTETVGLHIDKFFSAEPWNIFNITYRSFTRGFPSRVYWQYESLSFKTMHFHNNILEIIPWKLQDYSNEFKLNFIEVDQTEEFSTTSAASVKFNANFNLETKIGIKLGSSLETQSSVTRVHKLIGTNDDLGEAAVHFGDNIIIGVVGRRTPIGTSVSNGYILRGYNTGKCKFTIQPVRVQ